MGIVSFCPQGHRVKVKDVLAGKKGICPTCGARFRIPKVSAPPPAVAPAPAAAALPMATVVSLDATEAERLPRAVPFDLPPTKPAMPAAVAVAVEVEVEHLPEATAEPVEFEEDAAHVVVLHPAIAERVDLAWCHAVPGGAASEPLGAEAMQAWLDSGQAEADALVWRADWPEWRPLRAVFPGHAGR